MGFAWRRGLRGIVVSEWVGGLSEGFGVLFFLGVICAILGRVTLFIVGCPFGARSCDGHHQPPSSGS